MVLMVQVFIARKSVGTLGRSRTEGTMMPDTLIIEANDLPLLGVRSSVCWN